MPRSPTPRSSTWAEALAEVWPPEKDVIIICLGTLIGIAVLTLLFVLAVSQFSGAAPCQPEAPAGWR